MRTTWPMVRLTFTCEARPHPLMSSLQPSCVRVAHVPENTSSVVSNVSVGVQVENVYVPVQPAVCWNQTSRCPAPTQPKGEPFEAPKLVYGPLVPAGTASTPAQWSL